MFVHFMELVMHMNLIIILFTLTIIYVPARKRISNFTIYYDFQISIRFILIILLSISIHI